MQSVRTIALVGPVAFLLCSSLLSAEPPEKDVSKRVGEIVRDMRMDERQQEYIREITSLGTKATAPLLSFLNHKDPNLQAAALYYLQFAWEARAGEKVVPCLKSKYSGIRKTAQRLLTRHVAPEEAARLVEPLSNDRHLATAGSAFKFLERVKPDLARVKEFLSDQRKWRYASLRLSRYYSQELTPGTMKMLSKGNEAQRRAAVIALIHQYANSADTRGAVTRLLRDRRIALREAASEYLTWHGTDDELDSLRHAEKKAKDGYERAAVRAAIAAIQRRKMISETAIIPNLMQDDQSPYHKIISDFARQIEDEEKRKQSLQPARLAAIDAVRNTQSYEPIWRYDRSGKEPDKEKVRDSKARLRVQNLLFAIPCEVDREQAAENSADLPVARKLNPPLRGYFDPKRKSYGKSRGEGTGPFARSVHVGDDAGWGEEHLTVVAIGAGRVRAVWTGITWGGIIIIEHQDQKGERFCSLYGHLGPFMLVKTGDLVRKGQKIASLGRDYTWENGGYRSHIHFGIHKGPFLNHPKYTKGDTREITLPGEGKVTLILERQEGNKLYYSVKENEERRLILSISPASWICGYISVEKFKADEHGWVDPQEYIKKRMK